MRPSDMDAIARVIGQLVKEETGKLKTEQPDTSHYDAQFKALAAENASLSDQVKALVEENQNLTKTVSALMDRINTAEENLNKRVTSDELEAVANSVASCVKVDDNIAVINSLETRLTELSKFTSAAITKDDVNDLIKTMWDQDLRNQIAAMLPDEVDMSKAVETVHNMVMSELPETPTDLQVIEAVKTLYPSIRQDLIRRLPAMEHKGVWNAETQYDVGDEVIKNGSTYRLMEPSTDAPPSEAWQMISQGKVGKKGAPGRDGEKGERGEQGKDGVGIKDVVFVENMLVVELTDGSIKEFDLTPLKDDMGDQE